MRSCEGIQNTHPLYQVSSLELSSFAQEKSLFCFLEEVNLLQITELLLLLFFAL